MRKGKIKRIANLPVKQTLFIVFQDKNPRKEAIVKARTIRRVLEAVISIQKNFHLPLCVVIVSIKRENYDKLGQEDFFSF